MTRNFMTAVVFVFVVLANVVFASPALAQGNCEPISFPEGKDTAVLNGLAPVDDVICYELDANVGERFTLKVLRGDNTVFSIVDVQDAEDRFAFTAEKTSYELNVGQLMRAAGPEKFRISIKRSGPREQEEHAVESPWLIQISPDMKRVAASHAAEDGSARLTLACNKDLGGGVGFSLDEYSGNALGREDDAEYAARATITGSSRTIFDLRMHYFEPDKTWVSSSDVPAGFLQSFGTGSRLILESSDGIAIAAFDLKGSSKFSKAALATCGDSGGAVVDMPASATDEAGAETGAASASAIQDTGAGGPFRDCEHCPEMVPVPAGSFMMGASQKERKQLEYVDWATPQHQVSIGYPFAIGRFEITVDEFDAYVKETGVQVGGKCGIRTVETGPNKFKYSGTPASGGDKTESAPYVIYIGDGSYAQPGLAVTGRQPAVCVSRNEMKGYLDWLSVKAGKHYRLPTEAEWEYAYRAGTDTFNYWGNDFKKTCDYANFADRKSGYQAGMAASCSEKIHPDWTAEVGSYKPNPWGLYDMGGNVQEAVEDCFHQNYNGAPTDGSPWNEPDCIIFTVRGGDYELTQFSMRASERLIFGYDEDGNDGMWTPQEGSDMRYNVVGFRVAVSLDDTGWDKAAQADMPEKQAEVRDTAVATPTEKESGLRYEYLPAAVKTYVEGVRNSCRDYDPAGIPANTMAGIRPISLAGRTPALLIENENLCSDHYSGANCSNRGCDVVVMTEGDGGWKEIFHEHLYDDTLDIGPDERLKSITATVYAGDPHCGAGSNAKPMSSDSCGVIIRYDNKDWVWQKVPG